MQTEQEKITLQNIEHARNHPELVKYRETEGKFIVTRPEYFAHYRDQAVTIEQLYLSRPDDEFGLRVRKQYLPDGPTYSAELKDRGYISGDTLVRSEVPVKNLSETAFEYYAAHPLSVPLIQHRAYITPEMTLDFIDGLATPVIEIETGDAQRRTELAARLEGLAINVTETGQADKERIAHILNGHEKLSSVESIDVFSERVQKEMVAHYVTGKNHVVVGLTGMSGSGKTTVTRLIQEGITKKYGNAYRPVVLSTDDYHFGKRALEAAHGSPWTAWDDPRTYNTAELARDIALLCQGKSLIRRHFDFTSEEPVFDQEVASSPFIIIEGLYAGSSDLEEVRDLHFELPSSPATSIGRDVRRLIIENRANRAFPTAESRLKYQLEEALPLYLEQKRPGRNSFSTCARPMAERAFMLETLR